MAKVTTELPKDVGSITNTSELVNDGQDGLHPFITLEDVTSGVTDLSYTASPTNGIVVSSTGTDATIPLADNTNAGLLTSVEKSKIATALQSLNVDGLTDVTITGTTANKILGSTTEGIWENKTLKTINGSSILGSGDISIVSPWTVSGSDIYNSNSGNIGIGTSTSLIARVTIKGTTTGDGTRGIQLTDSSNALMFYVNNSGQLNTTGSLTGQGGVFSSLSFYVPNENFGLQGTNSKVIQNQGTNWLCYGEMRYGSDYSGTYTSRSLVDKAYVDAGLVLKSNIASPTFTGVITTPALTLSSTPTTSASTYDILTRNTSTGATEKISSSGLGDMTLGTAQTFTGTKTFNVAAVATPALNITNNIAGGTSYGLYIINQNSGIGTLYNQQGSGYGIKINNSSSGYGFHLNHSGTGDGIFVQNSDVGNALRINNINNGTSFLVQNSYDGKAIDLNNLATSTGIALRINNQTGATGNPFQYTKQGTEKAFINDAGDFSAQSITVLGTLGLRNVANTFTSLFTNTNTAARTYTLPDRSMTVAGTDEVILLTGNQTVTGRKAFNSNNTTVGGMDFTNSRTTNTGGTSDSIIIYINNSGSAGASIDNTGSGSGFVSKTFGTGDAANFQVWGTGNGVTLRNQGGTGDLLSAELGATRITTTGAFISNNITANGLLKLKAYTVATLPTGVEGAVAYCTDLLAPTVMSTAVGGGSVKWKVFYDGTSWKVG